MRTCVCCGSFVVVEGQATAFAASANFLVSDSSFPSSFFFPNINSECTKSWRLFDAFSALSVAPRCLLCSGSC